MPESDYKCCKRCGENKPFAEFSKTPNTRDGRFSSCKVCEAARAKARSTTPEGKAARAAASQRYRQRHPEKVAAAGKRYRENADPEMRKSRDRAYRERHPERIAARKKAQREKERARQQERLKRWKENNPDRVQHLAALHRERHPEKAAARRAVARAVRSGFLVKPVKCENCGVAADGLDLHGHHEDYSKPLDVVWLCRGCHQERHS